MTFNALIEIILCIIFLAFGVFFCVAYDAVQRPVLNQSMSYEVPVGRDFQEPEHLRSDQIKWGEQ